jgi:hypothetical protein
MKIFFDTEFIEDGKTIDLVSIGMVREDGVEFYAESRDADLSRASPWVKENVFPHLYSLMADKSDGNAWFRDGGKGGYLSRTEIASGIMDFAGEDPEFWADFASYDWVALCQLFGPMIDLPKGWPFFCRDVQQLRKQLGVPKFTVIQHGEHNALSDARECKARHDVLQGKFVELISK